MKRSIVMRTVFNDNEAPITDPPANAIVHPGDELADWVFQTGKTTLANKVFALGTAGGAGVDQTPACRASSFPFSRAGR